MNDVLTAAELRARIEEEHRHATALDERLAAAGDEINDALERQRLRRELEDAEGVSFRKRMTLASRRGHRLNIDRDDAGPLASHVVPRGVVKVSKQDRQRSLVKASVAYDSGLCRREFVWEIKGLAWLPRALAQEGRQCTTSPAFEVDFRDIDSLYMLAFSPDAAGFKSPDHEDFEDGNFQAFDLGQTKGTLALIRKATDYGTNVDVRFSVRGPSKEFEQWGDLMQIGFHGKDSDGEHPNLVLGPDLKLEVKGVFGLSFEDLKRSQWVQNDTITFKVEIAEIVMNELPGDILLGNETERKETLPAPVEVPPATLASDMLSMLVEGWHSDLTINVANGESGTQTSFSAHRLILSKRSDVFCAALSHEMSEHATGTMLVTDVPALTFKAMLHFIYSDDFVEVQKVLSDDTAASSAHDADAMQATASMQALLAAAHKYQLLRLLRWCEQQLCKLVNIESVCSLLDLASLYEAAELERCCLKFVQAHLKDLVERPEFLALSSKVHIKIQRHMAGLEPIGDRKRKRSAD